ncbi:beta-1,6-N-acetylglucosaminyltransferase [Desulfosediminicola flagellatus]|uniref:beta-1,6-N-acetylglucosaminyltransferase n=1 Tax=Desulfosediminicola flagellatus TaxID=2569541 RepID=UPI0010AC56FD
MTHNSQGIKIGFLILAHNNPARLLRLITRLHSEDPTCNIIIHYDRNSTSGEFQNLQESCISMQRIHILKGKNRIKCNWGGFSIVQATLNLMEYGLTNLSNCDYYYLLSGSCYPVRPLHHLKSFLTKNLGTAFIECNDAQWIKGGMREDRYLYRHFFNFKTQPWIFRRTYWLQRFFGIKHKLPSPIERIYFGSQWWCLPATSVSHIFKLSKDKIIINFFKRVWIPDECFFQSLIILNTAAIERTNHSLTYYNFDNLGRPTITPKESLKYFNFRNHYFIRKVP